MKCRGLLTSVVVCLAMNTVCFADAVNTDNTSEQNLLETQQSERVVVGARPLDPAVAAGIHKRRMAELDYACDDCGCGQEVNTDCGCDEACDELADESAALTDQPIAKSWVNCSEHWAISMDEIGGFIELEDESYWSVRPSHSSALWGWYSSDTLFITPNPTRWFSGYQYRIVNASTWTYVDANLVLSPVLYNPYTVQINSMSYSAGTMYLTDGTYWVVYSSDMEISNRWVYSDLIIVGRNNDKYTKDEYPYVLINVQMDEWVRAK